MDDASRTLCRTPNASGTTRIATWKFDLLRAAILDALGDDGLAFKDLGSAVTARLDAQTRDKLGSLGWHMTTVKLEMEVAGEIARVAGRAPQYLVRA